MFRGDTASPMATLAPRPAAEQLGGCRAGLAISPGNGVEALTDLTSWAFQPYRTEMFRGQDHTYRDLPGCRAAPGTRLANDDGKHTKQRRAAQ